MPIDRPDWGGAGAGWGSGASAAPTAPSGPIVRPDWGSGGERNNVSADPQADIDKAIVASGALTAGELTNMRAGITPAQADRYSSSPAHRGRGPRGEGLAPELLQEMHRQPDGFNAILESMNETAKGILSEVSNPKAFAAHFDTLSDAVQTKAYRVLMQNPGASLLDVLDRLERTLTLSEMAEMTAWCRKWKAS